ncbi:Hydroperoxide isomerase ALOXE3 [Acipenser ruthenus]|uniref:Hydroperoxide isomerase ALOXE3 n=1 Tax=Acipenser ruthenus TaxID=7906 RepID=A0A444UXY2_ACIRT|nr:hydroperoxide isomerase ALOXE3-like [Acipenser ruthenus]RXM93014.1 Hydroperoxide isomerase ALOXE3 [Acipenser ruthenus]
MVVYTYTVSVTTGDMFFAGTCDSVYITLIGTNSQSDKKRLDKLGPDFTRGSTHQYKIHCKERLGDILLIRLEKVNGSYRGDDWFCSKLDCDGEKSYFPSYRWVTGKECLELREGTAKKPNEDKLDILKEHRQKELDIRRSLFGWTTYKEGVLKCVDIRDPCKLPPEISFSFTKSTEFVFTRATAQMELKLLEWQDCTDSWTSMKQIEKFFYVNKTDTSVYVQRKWKEDDFFGYQYLNGTNPIMIQKCKQIPSNFPVTNCMVSGFLDKSSSLQKEMEKGNIFLVDYQLLDDIPANTIHGRTQYISAPLCLLYKDTHNKLKPIAIQLKQTADPENPIFLPNDKEEDWLLAKIFVRSADFNLFEVVTHLLRTHLLAEVFCMATLRHLASVHPLYKLLIPHMRYTLQINIMARKTLVNKGGLFDKALSIGGIGMYKVLQKAQESITYSSLCLPDDIKARGVEGIPNYYYRDDGLKLWAVINSFVQSLLKYYYPNDSDVLEDTELQGWINDIFCEGFLQREESGIPNSFSTVNELSKFLTMVIFTCSVQHSAVNSGQFDFYGWMPNASPTMQRPPPTKKGETTMEDILQSIANVSSTVDNLAAVWLLSTTSSDFIKLGDYPEKRFTEEYPQKMIAQFQADLKKIDDEIVHRIEDQEIGYTYMRPSLTENSVAI